MINIDEKRLKVRELDSRIISLIGERLAITKEIGKSKKKQGIPLKNFEVEKRVIANALSAAQDSGVDPELARSVMQLLINESCLQQEQLHYTAYTGNRENILIIGGLGEMGRWFSYFFENQGHEVAILDTDGKSEDYRSFDSLDQALDFASCVLVSVSLEAVPGILEEIALKGFDGVVFDVASLKGHIVEPVNKAREKGISITSMHPMFGPSARTLSDKIICFCDCGDLAANQKVEGFFADTSVQTVKLSLMEHDRVISYVLGLSHLVNIVFMKILVESGYSYSDLSRIASTTFLSQMKTTHSVISESPGLYYSIQKLNPFGREIYSALTKSVKELTDSVLSENDSAFIQSMERGKHWLEDLG